MPPPLSGTAASLWLHESPVTTYPQLDGDLSVDVAVIGGGLVGLTAATLLKSGGAKVAVVEAGRVGRGASGHAPGTLSALHGAPLSRLAAGWGPEPARAYAESSRAAVDTVATIVDERSIDCGFERVPDHLCAETDAGVRAVESEADAARLAGLDAALVTGAELPFPVRAALRLPDQAVLDPYCYGTGMARAVPGGGSHLLERTPALGVHEGEPCRVHTASGTIVAGDVVLATGAPIVDRGAFLARTYPVRSSLLAVRVERGPGIRGTYRSVDGPRWSVRTVDCGGERLVVVEGASAGGREGEAAALEELALERFGPGEVRHRWSAQDRVTKIGVPFAGRVTPLAARMYVATGLGDCGLAGATAAAEVLADAILRRPNLWSWVYDPNRWRPVGGLGTLMAHNLLAARRYAIGRLTGRWGG